MENARKVTAIRGCHNMFCEFYFQQANCRQTWYRTSLFVHQVTNARFYSLIHQTQQSTCKRFFSSKIEPSSRHYKDQRKHRLCVTLGWTFPPFHQKIHFIRTYTKHVKCIYVLSRLYGCETWSLTLREERRLRVFENRVLRRVFGPKRDEVTGEWRKLHNEELRDLYSLRNIVRVVKSRRMRWAGHVARMGRGEVYTGF